MEDWSDWESGDFLCAEEMPGAELPLTDILHRVAVGFRRVVIDWCEGDRWVDWRIAKHTELGSQRVIMDAEHSLRGRTALVSVADGVGPDAVWVRFFLVNHSTESLDLNYQPAIEVESGRVLAHKLGEILGYRFATAADSPDEEEGADHDILLHRDSFPDTAGRLPLLKGTLLVEELLHRIANRFPLAVIDRERGDPSVQRRLALVGRVAHVTIRDAVGGPQFSFFANPELIGTGLLIQYDRPQDRNACRSLLGALVAELEHYKWLTQDLDYETENLDE